MEELKKLSKLMKRIGKKNSRAPKKKVPISNSKISVTVKTFKKHYKVKIAENGTRKFVPRINPSTSTENVITKQDSCESNSSIGSLSASSSNQSFDSLFPIQIQTTSSDSAQQNSIPGQELASLDALNEVWNEIIRNPTDLDNFLNSVSFASWDVSQL